jgi:hypothetical protein
MVDFKGSGLVTMEEHEDQEKRKSRGDFSYR